jgi:hypothetical protein
MAGEIGFTASVTDEKTLAEEGSCLAVCKHSYIPADKFATNHNM